MVYEVEESVNDRTTRSLEQIEEMYQDKKFSEIAASISVDVANQSSYASSPKLS